MASNCPLIAFLCLAGALLTTGAVVTTKNDHGCPEGWTPFGTRCFKFFDSKLSWPNAEKSCHIHGANLASIHSTEEHAFIINLIKESSGENRATWIGGNDGVQDGVWMWTDGSRWDYTDWATTEPNGGGNEQSLIVNWAGNPFYFDAPGSWLHESICAKDKPPKDVSLPLEGFVCKCTPNMK